MPLSLHEARAQRLAAAQRDFAEGRVRQAAAVCRELLESSPTMAGACNLLGLIALRENQPHLAEDLLRRAAESPHAEVLHLLSYAELRLRERAPADAFALTRRAVELDPRCALAWYSLGNQQLERGAPEESRACFERALELDPRLWRARALLGTALARLGDQREGDRCFEQLLREEPDRAAVLDLQAGYLSDQGQLEDAALAAARALESAPQVLEYHLRAVQIELGRGRLAEVLERLEALAARWPRDARVATLRVTALERADRTQEAIDSAQGALAAGIESVDLLLAYGAVLHQAGRDTQALAVLERAQAERPAAALNERGIVLSDLGRFAEALIAFEQALAYRSAFAQAWYNKARAKRFAHDDPDIDALERLLKSCGSHEDRMLMHFALGKAYDEAGERTRAFEHWQHGNALKRATLSYDGQIAVRELELAAARPVPVFETAAPRGARSSEVPVFIVGMPRCGSTLLEQMLASHPEIGTAGERSGVRAQIERHGAQACPAAALAALERCSPHSARILDKDLRNFRHLDLIRRLFPRARIIHCRRDPLDTCLSAYTMLFAGDFPFTYDLRELGRYYAAYRDLMHAWRERLPAQVLLEIDYEALIEEPRVICERVLTHLGLQWSESCLSFHESARSILTASLMQARQPLYRSSIGRAARYAQELRPLIEALGASRT